MEGWALSREAASGLAAYSTTERSIQGQLFRHFCESIFSPSTVTSSIPAGYETQAEALAVFLLEAAKYDASEDQIDAVLSEAGIKTAYRPLFQELANQSAARSVLQRTGLGCKWVLVDMDWRLEHALRGRMVGREAASHFVVRLSLVNRECPDRKREITFQASLEEMQDLLATTRDAVKQVDRLLTAKSE